MVRFSVFEIFFAAGLLFTSTVFLLLRDGGVLMTVAVPLVTMASKVAAFVEIKLLKGHVQG